jgi:valyl-tRNA synthetase
MNTEGVKFPRSEPNPEDMSLADIWIQGKLHSLIKSVEKNITNYRIDLIANSLYNFVWNDYCNWYLELSKSILKDDDQSKLEQKQATQLNLLYTLDALLKCLHPIIPFITEELWQTINTDPTKSSIMVEDYPNSKDFMVDQPVLDQMDWLIAFVVSVRQIRSEMNISPKIKIPVLLQDASNEDLDLIKRSKIYITNLAGISEIKTIDEKPPTAAIALLKGMKILIPLEGIINIESERERCEQKLNRIKKELHSMKNRLKNKEFIAKAPKDVVENLRSQSENMTQDKIKMEEQIRILSSS